MKWRNFLRVGSKTLPIWAQAKHAILAMVRAQESDVENAIRSLLRSKGWGDPTIHKLKELVQPFQSDDPIMRDCHEHTVESGAGIVVYSDPIEDA